MRAPTFVQTAARRHATFVVLERLRRLVTDCTSFAAHHSWGLVFACQSVARSHQAFGKGTVDVIDEKVRRPLPTVTGIAARLAITALKTHNVAIAPLLQRAGLSAHDFDIGEQRISAASQGKFLEYAAEAMDDSAFGLHLAEKANPREAGLLFYVTSAASNIEEALALFARYSRIANEAVRIKPAHAREGLIAEISFIGLSRHAAKQVTELVSALRLRLCERSRVGISVRRT